MSRWRKKGPTDFFMKRLKKIDISIDEVPRLPLGLQSNHYKHDKSSVSACRWSWSSHRSKRRELRYALWLLRSWARADIRITILTSFFDNTHVQENRTSYWSSSYTQFQCDVLDARSNEKASRRSQRSESEEQRWTVIRDLENYGTRETAFDAQTTRSQRSPSSPSERQCYDRFQFHTTPKLMTMEYIL